MKMTVISIVLYVLGTILEGLEKGEEEMEIEGQAETTQTRA